MTDGLINFDAWWGIETEDIGGSYTYDNPYRRGGVTFCPWHYGSSYQIGKRIRTVIIAHVAGTSAQEFFWVHEHCCGWKMVCTTWYACPIGVYDPSSLWAAGL